MASNKERPWTMLVYLAGDNNLAEEMVWALQQMRRTLEVGKTMSGTPISDEVGVIAQFDARGVNPKIYKLSTDLMKNGDGIPAPGQDNRLPTAQTMDALTDLEPGLSPTPEQRALARWHYRRKEKDCLRNLESELQPKAQTLLITVLTRAIELEGTAKATDELTECLEKLVRPLARYPRNVDVEFIVNALLRPDSEEERELAMLIARSPGSIIPTLQSQACEQFLTGQVKMIQSDGLMAKNYAVVLSGHGNGAVGDFLPDSDPVGSLSVPAMGRILASACAKHLEVAPWGPRKIGILGLDSCLMSTAEVCCEVRDSVHVLVGAEGFVANTGWPYHRVLEALAEKADPAHAAVAIVQKYTAFYRDYELGGNSAQIAAVNLEEFGSLIQSLTELVSILKKSIEPVEVGDYWGVAKRGNGCQLLDTILLAHWRSQTFRMGQYVDLYEFCSHLKGLLADHGGNETTQKILQEIQTHFQTDSPKTILASYYCGPDFQYARGLSVYFPWSYDDLEPAYQNLKFAQETGWYSLLEMFLKRTQRPRRGQEEIDKRKTLKQPFRYQSDTEAMLQSVWLDDPLMMGLAAASKAGIAGNARAGIAGNARAGIAGNARAGIAGNARMLADGKWSVLGFQNPPHGYFRQSLPEEQTAGEPRTGFYGTE